MRDRPAKHFLLSDLAARCGEIASLCRSASGGFSPATLVRIDAEMAEAMRQAQAALADFGAAGNRRFPGGPHGSR